MIRRIRNSVFTKILWGLTALYLFNISVDTTDPNPEYIPEDLSFNDQESIIEVIVEQVLGYENAIKEYDDHDPEGYAEKKNIKIGLLVYQTAAPLDVQQQFTEEDQTFLDFEARLTNGFTKIDSPPPKV